MDTFGTHLPVLSTFAARTGGPILELGCGDNSTPVLHGICRGRKLYSVDHDFGYMDKFADLWTPNHIFLHVEDWSKFDPREFNTFWDVAFVDHAPEAQRPIDIDRLRGTAKYIIIHDTHEPEAYGLEPLLSSFKFRFDYKNYIPWTTVVSDFADPMEVWRG